MYWLKKYKPGPATVNGLFNYANSVGPDPVGAEAHVGDRICFENEQNSLIVYMQVTGIRGGYVEADAWLWNSA